MIEDLLSVEVFLSVCTTGSLQQAADTLGIDKSTASRKLSGLEARLGRKLFDREKRPLLMTADAKAIFPSARRMLEEKQKIENYYRKLRDDKSIQITLMVGNAHTYTPRFLDEYSSLNPSVCIDVMSPTDIQEFLKGRADIVCLSGQAELSNCVMLPRRSMIFVPVASPDYIARHGPIGHPSQLARHRIFSNLYRNRYDFAINYKLVKNSQTWAVEANNTVRYWNIQMSRQAVLEGLGVALGFPLFFCIDDLEAGRLVPILDGWHRPSHANFVVVKDDDWKIKGIRNFAYWWSKKLLAYEKECEARFVRLYDKKTLQGLLH